ncbi:hypothetical protein [Streptomyces sp. NBC_01320]|uniref:hypothetical protein n=1 Tax=Streptomyces sp. NBC_01320 TaxID=2903824 RepID=UPI002E0F93DE|nr:hypothetical protein OG395_41700 [Streptomyces sp. NBC_01320]
MDEAVVSGDPVAHDILLARHLIKGISLIFRSSCWSSHPASSGGASAHRPTMLSFELLRFLGG